MLLRIKRIYEPVGADDGRRVLVDRLWPRGVGKTEAHVDEWLKDIAPSDALRKWFAHDPLKWEEFKKKYEKELKARPDLMDKLGNEAKKGNLTLLFAAKDAEHNNAVVLMELLRR